MSYARALLRFLWEFVIGDDWRIAAAVVVAIAATVVLAHHNIHVWWLLPIVVVLLLGLSVWGAVRARR
ncbi:MAG: hypothetical protein ACP5H2_10130 [Solirubrobacteraceae bacterium]